MQLINPDNKGSFVYGEGYKISMETALSGDAKDTKLKMEFDLSGCDEARVALAACKDWLSDFNNNRRADVKRANEKGESLTELEAARARADYDEARDVYCIRVKDLWTRVRTAPVRQAKVADMPIDQLLKLVTPEQLAALKALLAS